MFKIIDSERLQDGQTRFVVETDDSSLFTSLSFLDSLVEFTGSFCHQSKIALRIKDSELTKDVRLLAAREDRRCRPRRACRSAGLRPRAMILNLFEETLGASTRERWNTVLQLLQDAGRSWMRLDGLISILKIARSERKESIQKNMAREQKKSA